MTLDAIRQHDPAFDQTRFLSRAEAVLSLVLRARAEGRLDQARGVVSDDMAIRLQSELEGQRAAGRRQVHDGVRVRSSEVVEARSDERWDTVAVRFSLEGASYEAKADGEPVSGANRDRRRWAEMWWFQRKADATTTAADDKPVDRCPACGAPLASTADGRCAYCQHKLGSPSTWVLSRITDAAASPEAVFSALAYNAAPVAKAAKTVGVIITVTVLIVVIGGIAAGVVLASRATKSVTNAFTTVTEPTSQPGISLPPGVTLPPGITLPGGGTGAVTTTTGFVTPVANPSVKAPVNDVVAAAAALQAKAGRPVILSDIHLYADGRINFEIQAADDPTGADVWTWKGGQLTGPEQSTIGVQPNELFPLAGLDLSNLARLCDAAIGASGIPDGRVDSPYLLKIGSGVRWYIPVQSESRGSTRKTYRVAPDGTKPEVF